MRNVLGYISPDVACNYSTESLDGSLIKVMSCDQNLLTNGGGGGGAVVDPVYYPTDPIYPPPPPPIPADDGVSDVVSPIENNEPTLPSSTAAPTVITPEITPPSPETENKIPAIVWIGGGILLLLLLNNKKRKRA
jgi:hypothetical protein